MQNKKYPRRQPRENYFTEEEEIAEINRIIKNMRGMMIALS